jgi:hypothetical protein
MTIREVGDIKLQGIGDPGCFTRGWRPESLFIVCRECDEKRSSVAAISGGVRSAAFRVSAPKKTDARSARVSVYTRGQHP